MIVYMICIIYIIYITVRVETRGNPGVCGICCRRSIYITNITRGNRVPVAKISHFFGFRECGIGGGMVERIEANTPPSRRIEPAVRRAVPAAALTDAERQVLEIVASDGLSAKAAFLAVFPDAADWPSPRLFSAVSSLRKRGAAYLAEIVNAAAEEAVVGRATLIQMALQDREFARETGNASAAVAATKNVAALCGISMKEPGDAGPTDPVALLEAVERLMRANRGEEAIDITPPAGRE